MTNQQLQQQTLFRIKSNGTGYYVVNGFEVEKKEFEKTYPVVRVKMKQNYDRTKLWMADEIVNELKEVHKSGNVDRIDPTINKLNETWNRISTDLYSKSNEPDKDNKSEPDTQDVSYEEVN